MREDWGIVLSVSHWIHWSQEDTKISKNYKQTGFLLKVAIKISNDKEDYKDYKPPAHTFNSSMLILPIRTNLSRILDPSWYDSSQTRP